MSIKSRKLFAILLIAMMMMTLLPMTAFAASNNSVDKVPQVSSDDSFDLSSAPKLRIEEKNAGEFSSSETFRLSLENAKWLSGFEDKASGNGDVNVEKITDTLAEVTIQPSGTGKRAFYFPLITEITGDGEAKVTIDSRDSAVSSGTYVFANSAAGKTIASISKVVSFSRSNELGVIQIDETRIGALGYPDDDQIIKIKLPPRFEWVVPASASSKVDFTGGLKGMESGVVVEGGGTRTLEITYNLSTSSRSARGSIFLNEFAIHADRDAVYGDVVADFDGDNITNEELLIAKHMDYAITADVAEVKDVVAGRYDNMTAKITIEENIAKSLIESRELNIVLPEWVKINSIKKDKATNVVWNATLPEGQRNEMYFIVKDPDPDKKSKYEFELELSVEADKTGDIVAEFFGAGMEKQELVIAKAVAPVTAEVAVSDLKIGVQNQDAPDIIITETKKGMIDDYIPAYTDWDSYDGSFDLVSSGFALTVSLPKDHEFAGTPTVEVTEGNLEIGKPSVKGTVLTIPIKSSSTKPSTIKISDVKVTLDRTVPEGAFNAKIGGTAIVKNNWEDATIKTPVLFDKAYVVKFHFADVITPAPGETRATTTFTIGSTTYTVVEDAVAVEKTMDVAPYIKAGRTYLPVRFVAYALGVAEDNIIWDPVTRSVTIFKGDRIAQMTIGSNTLMVNGVELTMDVAPEITNGRTMLPVRFMTQALGAGIAWDAETQTVTVTQ